DREALGGAVSQVAPCLLPVETMKELPGGIPEVKERRAVFLHQKPPVLADLQPRRRLGSGSRHRKPYSDKKDRRGAAQPGSHGSLSFHGVYRIVPHPSRLRHRPITEFSRILRDPSPVTTSASRKKVLQARSVHEGIVIQVGHGQRPCRRGGLVWGEPRVP